MSRGAPDLHGAIVGIVCECDGRTQHIHDPFGMAGVIDLLPSIGEQETRCDSCGVVYGIGCSPFCRDGHGRVSRHYGDGFEPRFDYGLGEYVTGWGDVRKAMREGHLDFRDHPSPAQTSDRRDKIADQQRRAQP